MSYSGFAALAVRMLKKFGASTSLRRPSAVINNEQTDTSTITPPVTVPVTAMVLPSGIKSDTVEQATMVLTNFRKVLIAPDAGMEPAQNDELLWEGKYWKIDGVAPLRPEGTTTVLYTAFIKVS
jgi:hypothetical protein